MLIIADRRPWDEASSNSMVKAGFEFGSIEYSPS